MNFPWFPITEIIDIFTGCYGEGHCTRLLAWELNMSTGSHEGWLGLAQKGFQLWPRADLESVMASSKGKEK